jgi:hypothetical protein
MVKYFPTNYGALYPKDELRKFGVHLVSDIGGGKSPVLGRCVAFYDFMRGIPTILLDDGDAIDHFVHKVMKAPLSYQEQLWKRVRYIDLSGKDGYVIPTPLYYRLNETEDPLTTAQRFIDIILQISPTLQNSKIMGEGAIRKVLEPVGVELVKRGWQISEITRLATKIPDSLQVELNRFTHSPTQRAIYAAEKPGIDWQELIEKQLIVLIDYRHVENPQFALSWVLDYFFTFLDKRGRHQSPISLVIDEFSMLQEGLAVENKKFTQEWNKILKNKMKGRNLWLYIAHQTMGQFDDKMGDLLLSIQTQIIGTTKSTMTARVLSQQLARIDQFKIKEKYDITATVNSGGGSSYIFNPITGENEMVYAPSFASRELIDQRNVYFEAGAQYLEKTDSFRDLPPLHFVIYDNGTRTFVEQSLLGTENDTDIKPKLASIEAVRNALLRTYGRKVDDVLAEIDARTTLSTNQPHVQEYPVTNPKQTVVQETPSTYKPPKKRSRL